MLILRFRRLSPRGGGMSLPSCEPDRKRSWSATSARPAGSGWPTRRRKLSSL